jgi:hydroxyacylglutathione hydrolase
MFFKHVYDKTLAQASYVIGCQKKGIAAVIDPKRDVDTYLKIAEENNFKITHIFETHIHADFLSGSRELAALTGADMYLSDEGDENWKYEFDHKPLKDGDEVWLGNLKIEVIHTPGHTPESISFILTDTAALDKPVMVFTGDFVFVGDVGRPDLLEKAAGIKGTQDIGANQMYDSLKSFSELPEYVQLWPGHGAGSACGKALGAVPSSTVGYEKIRNWAFQMLNDKKAFKDFLLEDQPEPPKYFAMMKHLNKVDRPLLTEVPKLKHLSLKAFNEMEEEGIKIIDTRMKEEYAALSIRRSLNIQNNNSLATWAGWLLGYDEKFALIVSEENKEEVTRKLMRIGLDNIVGYITPEEMKVIFKDELESYSPISYDVLKQKMNTENIQVVDVRGSSEYKENHIPGAKNIFVGTLANNLDQIPKNKKVVIHCQSGDRAATAYSILRKAGYNNVLNYSGGMKEWLEKEEAVPA